MNLVYQQAEEADIPAIFTQAKALVDAYEDVTTIDYDKVLAWMERKLTNQIGSYTRVCLEGQTCAYYCLAADGELDDFYVLPQFRGRGIGSEILNHCITQSPVPLWLYVFTKNTGAVALYQRFGFQITQTVGTTRVIMRRGTEK